MTVIDLKDAGLPECKPCAWMEAVEKEGWEGGGRLEPDTRYVALWYNAERRAFALVVDIVLDPVIVRIIEGSATELLAWIEENRPELVGADSETPDCAWRDLNAYAHDPEKEAAWWKLCDDVDEGRVGLGVDLGDA